MAVRDDLRQAFFCGRSAAAVAWCTPMGQSRPIYVDMDDVLCETARVILHVAERDFGKRVAYEAIHCFSLEKSLDLTPEQGRQLMHEVHRPEIMGAFPPIDGALDGLAQLIGMGVEIVVVTGRPPSTHAISEGWLISHRVPFTRFLHVDKYGRSDPGGPGFPVIPMRELPHQGFALAIEDSGEVAHALAEQHALPVVLLDRPWNRLPELREFERRGEVRRCVTWPQAVEAVKAILA